MINVGEYEYSMVKLFENLHVSSASWPNQIQTSLKRLENFIL